MNNRTTDLSDFHKPDKVCFYFSWYHYMKDQLGYISSPEHCTAHRVTGWFEDSYFQVSSLRVFVLVVGK